MTQTTPTYGLPYPELTDLVTNGAAAIQALAEGTETQLLDVRADVRAALPVDPRDYGAVGDGITDDTAAWEAAAAVVNGDTGVLRATRGFLIPPGTHRLTRRITLGKPGARYNGPGFLGSGREVSTIRWKGGTLDGPLCIRNGHQAVVQHVSVGDDSSDRAQFGVWFAVDDTLSGYCPRTHDLHVHNATVGLVVGAGTDLQRTSVTDGLAASGQANAGLHTGFYASAVDEGARLIGANIECQTFVAPNLLTHTPDARFIRSINARGVMILGGECDFEGATGTPVVVEAFGANLFGGAFLIKGMRCEEAAGLFWADPGQGTYNTGSSSSLSFSAEDVLNAYDRPRTDPADMVRMGYQGVVSLRNVSWAYPGSRVRWIGLSNNRFGTTELRGCLLNNAAAATNPTALSVLEPAGAVGTPVGGLTTILEGCALIGTDTGGVPTSVLPKTVLHQNQTDVQTLAGAWAQPLSVEASGTARGVRLGKGTALLTGALRGTQAFDAPSIAAGGTATFTIAVPGAAVGDTALVSRNVYTAGLTYHGAVSAADTVTVVIHNTTGAAVDPANSTYAALVLKATA